MRRWGLLVIMSAMLVGFGLALLFSSGRILGSLSHFSGALLCLIGVSGVLYGMRKQENAPIPAAPPPVLPIEKPTPSIIQTSQASASGPVHPPDPKIIAIGGGTGMPQLLRGLRAYTDHITAIVTVADDGGSSGRLRRKMGVLPPGDFRNNIAALSDAEQLMTRLFQYRFADHDVDGAGNELAGHSFGNLFITTMAAITGSFETGLAESSRVLAVRGSVFPSTLEHITLCAEVCFTKPDGATEWRTIEGESSITQSGGRIVRVFLKPDQPRAYPAVIKAILEADLIVAGPGSFFTSVMPNLLVPAVRDAICASQAIRLYLCNVATQSGETDGFTVSDHMRHLRHHAGDAFRMVLANRQFDPSTAPSHNAQWVTLPRSDEPRDYQLFTGDIVDPVHPWRHSSQKLAARLMEVFTELHQEKKAAQF